MKCGKNLEVNLPVIILGDSDVVTFGIVKSLKRYKIPIVVITWNKHSIFSFSRFIKAVIKAPDPIRNEKGFISFLWKYGGEMYQECKTRILLFPSADTALILIANHYDKLKQYFIMLGDPNEMNLWKFLRKDLFIEGIKNIGVPLSKTMSCINEKDIEKVVKEMIYPCIVKPAEKDLAFSFYYQHGTKAVVARNKSELEKVLRENLRTKLLIQELIPGDTTREYSWCGYVSKNGEFIQGIVGQMYRKPPYQTATFVTKKENKELEECSQKILCHSNFWGICEIEYKKDPRDCLFKLIEMNPRCCMWFYLTTGCGLNLPYIAYREVYYNELPKNIQMKQEMKWVSLKGDFIDAVFKNKDGKFFQKLHYWLRSLEGRKVYAMFDLSDPLVVVTYWVNILINGVLRFARRIIKR